MAERTLLGHPSLGSDGHAPINDLFFALIEQLALIRIDLAYGVTSQANCVTLTKPGGPARRAAGEECSQRIRQQPDCPTILVSRPNTCCCTRTALRKNVDQSSG